MSRGVTQSSHGGRGRAQKMFLVNPSLTSNYFSGGWSVANYSDNGIWVNKTPLIKVIVYNTGFVITRLVTKSYTLVVFVAFISTFSNVGFIPLNYMTTCERTLVSKLITINSI